MMIKIEIMMVDQIAEVTTVVDQQAMNMITIVRGGDGTRRNKDSTEEIEIQIDVSMIGRGAEKICSMKEGLHLTWYSLSPGIPSSNCS